MDPEINNSSPPHVPKPEPTPIQTLHEASTPPATVAPAAVPAPAPVFTTPPAEQPVAGVARDQRNFLAAFVLAVAFGAAGLNRLYTGHKTIGWIRFGLYFGGLLLTFIGIGLLLQLVAYIWALADVFMLYFGKRVDADGQPLYQNARDVRSAKLLLILTIIIVVIVMVIIIAIIVASSFFYSLVGNLPGQPSNPIDSTTIPTY